MSDAPQEDVVGILSVEPPEAFFIFDNASACSTPSSYELGVIVGPRRTDDSTLREIFPFSEELVLNAVGRCRIYGRRLSDKLFEHGHSFAHLLFDLGFDGHAARDIESEVHSGRTLIFIFANTRRSPPYAYAGRRGVRVFQPPR